MPNTPILHDHGHKSEEIIKKMPDIEHSSLACEVFTLLSDSTRLRIIWLLCHSEECVTNISLAIGMSSPAVSHHLRFLRQARIIVSRKDGKETYYTLADTEKANLIHKMIDDVFLMECPNK